MKKSNPKFKMSYEPEADVLRIETGQRAIAHASEVGNVIIHVDKRGVPVYFEILEATGFLKRASVMLDARHRRMILPALR